MRTIFRFISIYFITTYFLFIQYKLYSDFLQYRLLHFQSMATSDMDQNQAETFLTSQRKKRDGGITEDQSKAFLKLWKTHRLRIHETLVQRCSWNNRLKSLSWRIDVQSRSRKTEQMNTASAIIEMQLEKRSDDSKVCTDSDFKIPVLLSIVQGQ